MIRRDHAFYRSTLVRISLIITGAFLTYLLSPWGPDLLRRTPSLQWLNHLLPWWLLSAGFLVYTALLVWGTIGAAVIADFLGLFMYGCEFIALTVTAFGAHPTNGWAMCAFALAIILHIAAGRLALYEQESIRAGQR